MLYALLAPLRLRAIGPGMARAAPAFPPAPRPGIAGAFAGESRRVLAVRGSFMILILAPLIYALYFPQPYLNQIRRKIPIAVVDNDLSDLSQRIVQTLDASGAVSVTAHAATLADARAALDRGEAFAAIGIPPELGMAVWIDR